MQVKKFEARSMKEALEMVKTQMGPDAIILSARDNNKSFGLVGEGSVEVTAAVSEQTLQRKKFAESRMTGSHLEQFSKSPARVQKNIIENMVNKHVEKTQPRAITTRRYIDIDAPEEAAVPINNTPKMAPTPANVAAFVRGPAPATAAASAPARAAAPAPTAGSSANLPATAEDNKEIQSLRTEIATLREIIASFKDMPQNLIGSTGTHPGADYGIPYDLSYMFEKLTAVGVAREIAAEILTRAQETIPALKLKNKNLVDGWVARHILETTPIVKDGLGQKIHCFIGPSGSGKTTAMVKFASDLVLRHGKKVALLTTDTMKVGAADQMRIYAQILNVPFAIVRTQNDWNSFMKYLSEVDIALVDFPGLSLKNQDEIEALNRLLPPAIVNPRFHMVLNATFKDADVMETSRRYSILGVDDVIFTCLDESTQHGTIYNFTRRTQIPLHSFGVGPKVPDDLEPATKERVLDLIFKLTEDGNKSVELR